MMIRSILADDEPLSMKLMEKQLIDCGVEIAGAYTDPYTLVNDLKNISFNTAFLDIQLPGINGMDLAALIHEEKPDIQIVFVTAHRDYAIKAFELETTDYLLKPVLKERLMKTISRIQERLAEENMSKSLLHSSDISLQIRCFKQFSILFNGEPIHWKTAKMKELCAFFVLHIDTPIHRETLIDKIWPDHDYNKAKNQLHTCISYLRKELEKIHPSNTLIFSGQHYTLHLEHAWIDTRAFDQLPEVIKPENIEMIEKKFLLYTGDFLEEESYDWAREKANELSVKFNSLLLKLAYYYEEAQLVEKYTKTLQKILQYNPYSEFAVRKLMLNYASFGMRTDALQLYEHFKHSLFEDIGIFPEKKTSDIYNLIKQGNFS